jgi:hypothetical protein
VLGIDPRGRRPCAAGELLGPGTVRFGDSLVVTPAIRGCSTKGQRARQVRVLVYSEAEGPEMLAP